MIGFAFLCLRFFVTLLNFLQKPYLKKGNTEENTLVSVLIPARNEVRNIEQTLRKVFSQGYDNLEVHIMDDGSTDGTGDVVKSLMKEYGKLHLHSGKPLPEGWLGKVWACRQLSEKAKGDYFLFIDADVSLEPGAVEAALYMSRKYKPALLSVFPDQTLKTTGEKLVVPIMHFLLLTLLPLKWVYSLPFPSMSAANGQFMFFEAKTYRRFSWHEQVKDCITEDIEIVKRVKQQKLKAVTLLGNGLVRCRMYGSFGEAVSGFSKNVLSGFGGSIPGLTMYLLLLTVAYFWWPVRALEGLTASALLIVLMNLMLARMSRRPFAEQLFLHLPKLLALVWTGSLSVYKTLTKTITWKDRKIP